MVGLTSCLVRLILIPMERWCKTLQQMHCVLRLIYRTYISNCKIITWKSAVQLVSGAFLSRSIGHSKVIWEEDRIRIYHIHITSSRNFDDNSDSDKRFKIYSNPLNKRQCRYTWFPKLYFMFKKIRPDSIVIYFDCWNAVGLNVGMISVFCVFFLNSTDFFINSLNI